MPGVLAVVQTFDARNNFHSHIHVPANEWGTPRMMLAIVSRPSMMAPSAIFSARRSETVRLSI